MTHWVIPTRNSVLFFDVLPALPQKLEHCVVIEAGLVDEIANHRQSTEKFRVDLFDYPNVVRMNSVVTGDMICANEALVVRRQVAKNNAGQLKARVSIEWIELDVRTARQ